MKKKVLALLLGGIMAVGGLSMQTPVSVEAMTGESGTVSAPRTVVDCNGTFSDPHIKSSEVTAIDGKLAVTIDLAIEYEEGFAELYVFENPVETSTGYGYVKDPVTSEWVFGEIEFYNVLLEASFGTPPAATMRIDGGNNTYTFTELSADKTYHVYLSLIHI